MTHPLSRAAALSLLVIGGCRLVVDYPGYDGAFSNPDGTLEETGETGIDTVDSDPPDTDPPDSDPPDTDPPAPPCEEAWWPGADLDADGALDLVHRVRVTVGATSVAGAPGAVDLDAAGLLAAAGVEGSFDPDSVRVVVQDCASMPSLPSQFVDRLGGLGERVDHTRPAGDGAGSVVFLWDTDGDLETRETMPGDVMLGVYFTTGEGTPPVQVDSDLALEVVGEVTTLAGGGTTLSVDAARGGLMSALGVIGGESVASQAGSCCGNAMGFWSAETASGPPFGWVAPQKSPAAVEILAEGPLITAVRSGGTLEAVVPDTDARYGTYTFEHWYWRFAGRPEIWHVVSQRATEACTTEHEIDASFAFRPVQVIHTLAQTSDPTWVADQAAALGAVYQPDAGFAVGLHQRPTHYARVANPVGALVGDSIARQYLAIHGNETFAAGAPTPASVQPGEAIFDAVGMIFLPFDGDWSAAEPIIRSLQDGLVTGTVGGLEAPP